MTSLGMNVETLIVLNGMIGRVYPGETGGRMETHVDEHLKA